MHPNHTALMMFLKALEERDPQRLDAALHPSVEYRGPLFPSLSGFRVFAMWQMLFRWPGVHMSSVDVKATPMQAAATWQLSFVVRRKKVVANQVTSTFEFRDDRIRAQHDDFSLVKYLAMQRGFVGYLIGWLPPVQSALQRQLARELDAFIDEHSLSDSNRLAPPPPKKKKVGPDISVSHEHGQRSHVGRR